LSGRNEADSREEFSLATPLKLKLNERLLLAFRLAEPMASARRHLIGANDKGLRPRLCDRLGLLPGKAQRGLRG